MKATICDFCRQTTPESDEAMLYDVFIAAAESFDAQQPEELAVLFDARDVCHACADRVRREIAKLKLGSWSDHRY